MLKNPQTKYQAFAPIHDMSQTRTWPNKTITHPPIWCSVDLRDGNQSLIEPMDIARKLKMFKLLLKMGFKEIEVGFPSASQIEFDFVRLLIEEGHIPDDVSIQVLTQARAHLIERSFESLKGAKNAIVHMYNSTAPVMREVVLKQSREGVIKMATDHATLILELSKKQPETNWRFEYSPEMFSSTELDFAKEISEAVVEAFQATPQKRLILNLPSTVECASANIFADQIEWMHTHLKYRDSIIISVHPHNDRGTGTAAAELSLMAGADRLEGCLFGNGERTGNLDLVNVALNMYTQGVHPNLEIDQIDEIRAVVEYCNQLPVHPRHPYVGDLVYTSFSGSHQDAIKKAFENRKEGDIWWMPYLPIDPKDLGRSYEAVIRVNSQSGKGGISYLLQQEYGLELPRRLQIEFSHVVQNVMDQDNKEFNAQAIWQIFDDHYLQANTPYTYQEHHLRENSSLAQSVEAQIHLKNSKNLKNLENQSHELVVINGLGNGPIDAVTQGLNAWLKTQHIKLEVLDYHEHAMSKGQDAKAICYVEMRIDYTHPQTGEVKSQQLFGVGSHQNIITASFQAILSGLNRYLRAM